MDPRPVNAGEVRITLAGEDRVLRSSLRAAKTVSASLDGFLGALQRVARFDHDAFVTIVAVGLGYDRRDDIEEVERKVFETGLPDLVAPVTKYVGYLMRGGKDEKKPTDGEEGKP
jgi:hypothetical protein